MAGSALVVTMSNPYADDKDTNKVILDWTSDDSDGSVSIDIASTYATAQALLNDSLPQPSKIMGSIVKIETVPGTEGDLTTAKPTALYDITILDAYGLDVAGGSLANRSGTVAESVVPDAPIPIDSELTLTIASAGNSKTGRTILFIKPEVM